MMSSTEWKSSNFSKQICHKACHCSGFKARVWRYLAKPRRSRSLKTKTRTRAFFFFDKIFEGATHTSCGNIKYSSAGVRKSLVWHDVTCVTRHCKNLSTFVGLSKFTSAVVLICEVKATVDGMSLRLPLVLVWYALKKEICVSLVSVRKAWQRGNLNPPNRPHDAVASGIQQDACSASYCLRRFHVRLITGLLRQKSIPPDGLVNSVFL